MKHYQHLCKEERVSIRQAMREGTTQKQMAASLGRHPSTIRREIQRNTYPPCHFYTSHWALHSVRHRHRHAKRHKYRQLTEERGCLITQLIRQRLSPEQVSGYLKAHHAVRLRHEPIDRFIDSAATRKAERKPLLRQGGRARRKRYGSGARASCIPNCLAITEHPQEVEEQERRGD